MTYSMSKDWCMAMAHLEGDVTPGAGKLAVRPVLEEEAKKPRDFRLLQFMEQKHSCIKDTWKRLFLNEITPTQARLIIEREAKQIIAFVVRDRECL